MRVWYKAVIETLQTSGLFGEVSLVGAKVRASLDETRFLDIHLDPTTQSYSYALIDLRLPYPGDKRVFGWDDYPHQGVVEIQHLERYPTTSRSGRKMEAGYSSILPCRAISSMKLTLSLPP